MYGPPEYGANRNLVGWSSNGWAGDTQPRGFSRARVTTPDHEESTPDHEDLARDKESPPALTARLADIPVLPDLSGRPAPRDAWWLARGRFGRR